MKLKKRLELLVLVLLLGAGVLCNSLREASAAPGQKISYDALIEKADNLARQGQFAQALDAAQQAVKLNPDHYEGYYYSAYALFKQDQLDQATQQVSEALHRVDENKKATVQKLADAITNRRTALEQIKIGDAALANGLLNNAATAYTKAWDATPTDEALGLKAAKLWIDHLDKLPEGARILNTIIASPRDMDVAHQATEILSTLKPKLENLYNEKLRQGMDAWENAVSFEDAVSSNGDGAEEVPFKVVVGEWNKASQAFREAENLLPMRSEAYVQEARIRAGIFRVDSNNVLDNEIIPYFKKLMATGPLDFNVVFKYTEFHILLCQPEFVSFLKGALGDDAVAKAQAVQDAQVANVLDRIRRGLTGVTMGWMGGGPPVQVLSIDRNQLVVREFTSDMKEHFDYVIQLGKLTPSNVSKRHYKGWWAVHIHTDSPIDQTSHKINIGNDIEFNLGENDEVQVRDLTDAFKDLGQLNMSTYE